MAIRYGVGDPIEDSAQQGHGSQTKLRVARSERACEAELCTGGPLSGGLEGTLSWTMTRMEATSDPDVVKLIGVNVVTTETGTLSGTDYTFWNLVTGDFVDFTVIAHGTGAFAGAKGTLVIQGGFDAASGTGTSRYVAVLKLAH